MAEESGTRPPPNGVEGELKESVPQQPVESTSLSTNPNPPHPDPFVFTPPSDGKSEPNDEQPIELTTASQRLRTASGNSLESTVKTEPEAGLTSSEPVTTSNGHEDEDDEEAKGPSREFLLIRRPSYRKILNDLGGSINMISEDKGEPSISGSESSNSEDLGTINGGTNSVSSSTHNSAVTSAAAAAHISALSSGVLAPGGVFQTANHVLSNSGTNSLTLTGSDPVHTFTMTANNTPPVSNHATSGRAHSHGNSAHLIQYAQDGNSFLLPAALTAQGVHGMGHNGATGLLGHGMGGHHDMSLSPTGHGGGGHGGDDNTRKREMRLMKNREAARECRRKKKEYIKCLENRVAVLENQNKALIEELKSLKELYTGKQQA